MTLKEGRISKIDKEKGGKRIIYRPRRVAYMIGTVMIISHDHK